MCAITMYDYTPYKSQDSGAMVKFNCSSNLFVKLGSDFLSKKEKVQISIQLQSIMKYAYVISYNSVQI